MTKKEVLATVKTENRQYYDFLVGQWGGISDAAMNSKDGYVLNGMVQTMAGRPVYPFKKITSSRHLTVVFNLFVFCQIFNMICARKINDEYNVFKDVIGNKTFIAVWLVIFVVQCCVTQFAGPFVKIHNNGLTGWQWIFCVVGGMSSFIINAALKPLPESYLPVLGDEDEDDIKKAQSEYMNLRKTRELSSSVRQGRWIENKP